MVTEVKRTKRQVILKIDGNPYVLNAWGVLCSVRLLDNGKKWYSFADFKASDQVNVRDYALGFDYTTKHEKKYFYK